MKKIKLILSITMVFCFLATGISFAQEELKDLDYLESVIEMIEDNYSGDIYREELLEGALKGMFDTMDDYTTYYTKEEADDYLNDMDGSYKGIGIMFSRVSRGIIVLKVFESSPAESSGIKEGDIIKEVDGVDISDKSDEQVATMIRGEEGTTVSLEIMRKDDTRLIEVERREIKIEPGEYKIENYIGYIKLEVFNANTEGFINEALEEMDNNNIDKIILDLRNNPGGEVGQAIAVAKKFVPAGLITRLEFESESMYDQVYNSRLINLKYDVVVLVNEMSASASEILAGAIQDKGAGMLIGTKTFGKAKVQSIFPIITPEAHEKYKKEFGESFINGYDLLVEHKVHPLDDEIIGWTKMTTGRYYTPKGRMIDGKGLEPDMFVDNIIKGVDVRNISQLNKIDKPDLGEESIDVYNAKKILTISGYEVGNMDMTMDKTTFNSIAEFQKDEGLYPYGVLDFSTQEALNEKFHRILPEPDIQYYKAVEILSKH
ncbi:S41 family peptidase [Herbivorax sp. ANBcel31]|uniref:S41 family peptidase n=1 Tax=Herbivorax sp. ANBcel31 TaxID=3069754 RepID=UPI0027B568D9|nr:S41 family peptidase [Herbivorax sp. ANBcel31]MDQ2084967.1 S41 family peptidase [Herbivorax sp. ANBcel31]